MTSARGGVSPRLCNAQDEPAQLPDTLTGTDCSHVAIGFRPNNPDIVHCISYRSSLTGCRHRNDSWHPSPDIWKNGAYSLSLGQHFQHQ